LLLTSLNQSIRRAKAALTPRRSVVALRNGCRSGAKHADLPAIRGQAPVECAFGGADAQYDAAAPRRSDAATCGGSVFRI
jgi:hypothetical protein